LRGELEVIWQWELKRGTGGEFEGEGSWRGNWEGVQGNRSWKWELKEELQRELGDDRIDFFAAGPDRTGSKPAIRPPDRTGFLVKCTINRTGPDHGKISRIPDRTGFPVGC